MYGLPAGKDTDRRSASPRMTESSLPICSAIPNRTDRFRASCSNNSDEISLLLPPAAKSNPASTTSGSENIESTATISAKPSWKAAWSGVALHVPPAQAIKQRVRRFVCDDVMRETGEDRLAVTSHEIAKKDRPVVPRIKCIGIGECVRDDVNLMSAETPGAPAPECEFELCQRAHRNRVHVLGMEPRILQKSPVAKSPHLQRGAAALFERERILVLSVQRPPITHRFVKCARRRVVVDDVDTVPARAGQKFFSGHRQLRC